MHTTPSPRPRTTIGNLRRRGQAAVLAATLVTGFAACGGDDDGFDAKACDAFADLQAAFFGDPAAIAPAAEAFAAAAPKDLKKSADVLAAAATSEDEGAGETPEYVKAQTAIANAVFDDCKADAKADVKGVDYKFNGMPTTLAAGRLNLRFTNETQTDEPHELVIVTGANGESAADLQQLPIEELFGVVRPVTFTFTGTADGVAATLVDLEPGEYLVICTLPVGGFEAAQDGPGDPHANHGMVQTLTVTA